MTDEELKGALPDIPSALEIITTLRAQLAGANARADRAEAALAAQIEVDAAICTDIMGYDCMKADGETYQPMWVQKVAKGMVSLARQDIRSQPHDRTALDRYREKVLREASDACLAVSVDLLTQVGREHAPWMKATAEDCSRAILALIEVKP